MSDVPRWNIEVDAETARRAKAAAALRDQTLREFVIESVQKAIAEDEKKKPKR